jgi:hypothetical protein
LKGMLHSRFFWVMNCMTWCRSIVTSCLVFNPASRSFMVFDWPIIGLSKVFYGCFFIGRPSSSVITLMLCT